MSKINVKFNIDDWVWLCEFLSTVIKEEGTEQYLKDDMEHLRQLLLSAENGFAETQQTIDLSHVEEGFDEQKD